MKLTELIFSALFLSALMTSCTLEKTDFDAEIGREVTETHEFKEALRLKSGNYQLTLEALNGMLYKGYNEIRVKISDTQHKQDVKNANLTFLPLKTGVEALASSCPHSSDLVYSNSEGYYYGYVVFTSESNAIESWKIHLTLQDRESLFSFQQSAIVHEQTNKNLNMTSFTGKDNVEYIIALAGPLQPKVAENELIAGIYKHNQMADSLHLAFSEVNNYTLLLDPRMPEPSMGNHSSPNNKDLTQKANGLYYGVVNYTMTGNWTLNFRTLNQAGEILKGTEVPIDFTPGVHGVKSELFIDTLF